MQVANYSGIPKISFFLVVFCIGTFESVWKLVVFPFLTNDTTFHSVIRITNLGFTADSPPLPHNYLSFFITFIRSIPQTYYPESQEVSKFFCPVLVMSEAFGSDCQAEPSSVSWCLGAFPSGVLERSHKPTHISREHGHVQVPPDRCILPRP